MTDAAARSVERYIAGYLQLETQEAADGSTDPQLATIVLALSERLASSPTGSIIDIGCGSGALLSRLAELPVFKEKPGWVYVPVDEDKALDQVQRLSRDLKLSRRVEPVTLKSFYEGWPELPRPIVVFCRNVLHELDIPATAQLIASVSGRIAAGDELLIQDLTKLPISERRSACWVPSALEECLRRSGFQTVHVVEQRSRSGNAWFNLIASSCTPSFSSIADYEREVTLARKSQWDLWSKLEDEDVGGIPGRGPLIEALDIDLQLTALTRQLRDAGSQMLVLAPNVQKKVRQGEFNRRVEALVSSGISAGTTLPGSVRFRERGGQMNDLEAFLRSLNKIAVVFGGPGTGKTTLVSHLMSERSYEKATISIDGSRTKTFWPFIESMFSQVGLNLAPELLSVLDNKSIYSLEPALRRFMNAYAGKVILFYDNFDQVQGSGNVVNDPALRTVLDLWASRPSAKIILASRSEYIPASLQSAAGRAPITVRVGRYASQQTVENVLDDYFDRRAAGVEVYPELLLDAIDRHPLIASLAAQNLQKYGASVLLDESFIVELRGRLRRELWGRLADDESVPALYIGSQLRVSVPERTLSDLSSPEAVSAARRAELVYAVGDQRWGELLSTLGLFRIRDVRRPDVDDAIEESGGRSTPDHQQIAGAYRVLYRLDDDPKWLRESYFHRILAGGGSSWNLQGTLGQYYYDELVASAEYTYLRRRDYSEALKLYELASSILVLSEPAEMRRASSLVRCNHRERGEDAFTNIVLHSPTNRNIKTSHVDALLYIRDFDGARAKLKRYDLKPADSDWITYQWGRTRLGLNEYNEAATLLEELLARNKTDVHFFTYAGRALELAGDFARAEAVLTEGFNRFKGEVAAITALGTFLERIDKPAEALALLKPVFDERRENTQAAASLVRIYRQAELGYEAGKVLKTATRRVGDGYGEYIAAAEAENLLVSGRYEDALQTLASGVSEGAHGRFLLFRAIRDSIKHTDGSRRDSIISLFERTQLADSLRLNAPIQLMRAEIALMIGSRSTLESAIWFLERTRVPRARVEVVRGRASPQDL